MKLVSALAILSCFGNDVCAFVTTTNNAPVKYAILQMGYVPDGMSPEQYSRLREKEKQSDARKKFGAYGPQSFQSRSLQSFQQDLEKGQAGHLMPVFNAKDKVKKGMIRSEDVPYMQRGGNWDNSDVKTAKKKKWNETDKKYIANYRPSGLDWMGSQQRPSNQSSKTDDAPKRKLFGLF